MCGLILLQVNEFVKRVRAAKIHTLIMGHLRKQMPAMMGKQKAQEKLLRDLAAQFSHVQREHHLPAGKTAAFMSEMRICSAGVRVAVGMLGGSASTLACLHAPHQGGVRKSTRQCTRHAIIMGM